MTAIDGGVEKAKGTHRVSWDMFGTCLEHVWGMFGTCLGHVWKMFGTCLGHVWGIFGTCLEHVWHMFGTCSGHVWDVFGTCLGRVWDMFVKVKAKLGLYRSEFHQDMHGGVRLAWFWVFPGY